MDGESSDALRESGSVMKGEKAPARVADFEAFDLNGFRKMLNLTQTYLAKRLGVNVRTLRRWEKLQQVPGNHFSQLGELLSAKQKVGHPFEFEEFVRRSCNKQLLAEINDAVSTLTPEEDAEIAKFGLFHAKWIARRESWD